MKSLFSFKQASSRRTALVLAGSITALAAVSAFNSTASAANSTWIGGTDGLWTTAANWSAGVPGITTFASGNNTAQTDIVTFNSVATFSTITVDNLRFVNSLAFVAGAGSYNITGGLLYLRNGGSISMASGVTNAQTISASIQVRQNSSTNGTYSFVNNSATSAATLSFTNATFTLTNANGRPTTLTLDGSNTGGNIISSAITNATSTQAVNVLTKAGAGTWILSGSNTFNGTGATTVANGIQINGGTLVASNNAALGTNGTANTNQVSINSTGTLQITNGITIDNGLSLNLNNGGTIQGVGTAATNGRINVGTAAATNVTISTVSSGDVFTFGGITGDFVGGAADTNVHIAGLGTVFQNASATAYLGGWSIDAGTLKLGSATNGLGLSTSAFVAFGASTTGKLQLNGNSNTIIGLTTNATPGTAVVENGLAGTATLIVNNAAANTFAGVLRNGTAGTLAVTKGAAGTLTLSGNANTYSGATTVSAGVLNVTNTTGSATGASSVALGTATLTGAGIITGTVTAIGTSTITPGTVTAGSAGSGVLTLGNLTLVSGTTLNYGLVSTGNTPNSNNYISTGALSLPGSGVTLNLYTPGTSNPFAAAGVYNLFQYTSLPGVALTNSTFSFGTSIAGYNATFGTSGGFLQLTLVQAGALATWTNGGATGNWSLAGNWSGSGTLPPQAAGDSATFGATAPGSVNLDVNETVGGLTFNNASAFTISSNNSSTLTLDNINAGVTVTVTTGAHAIQNAVAFNDNVAVAAVSGTQLTIAGNISEVSGTRSLTKTGTGTLVLSGSNGYSGGTVVSNGVVEFNSLGALGTGTTLALGAAATNGTLRYASGNTADISSLTVTLNAGGGTIDTNGNNVTLANAIGNSGAGALTKAGTGILTLNGVNTFTGGTVIKAGTLSLGNELALGPVPGGAATNVTFDPGAGNSATLQFGNFSPDANRSLLFNSGTGVLDTQANTVTLTGASSGSGVLAKSGSGTLVVFSAQGYTGGTVVNAGTLAIKSGGSVTGNIALNNGTTFSMLNNGSNSVFIGNNITLGASSTVTFASNVTANGYSGLITGDANSVINLTASAQAFNFSASNTKQFQSFLGTVNVVAGSSMDSRGSINANGGDNTTFVVDGFVSAKNGGSWTFGALSSTGTTGNLGGSTNYIVGAKSLNTTYAGNITTNAGTGLTKLGTGTLALTGTGNTYTGTTLISAGTLQIGSGGSTGTLGNGGLVTNNASLIFNRSDAAYTVANGINGSGTVGIQGGGTITFTAANGYTGLTTISGGSTLNINGQFALGGSVYGGLTFGTGGGTLQYATAFSGNGSGDISQNAVGVAKPVTFTGTATIDTNGNNVTYANTVGNSGAGGLTKTGAGSLALNGANNYTGVTTVSNGTLQINGSLSATTAVNINAGTLLLGANNVINDAAAVTLGGGTLNSGGFSDTLGALTLTANSTIDFGAGNASELTFTTLTLGSNSLNIWNWTATNLPAEADGGVAGDGLRDRLLFTTLGSLSATELSQIHFFSDAGSTALGYQAGQISFGGNQELVPVPEPTTIFGALALLGLVGYRERRRLTKLGAAAALRLRDGTAWLPGLRRAV